MDITATINVQVELTSQEYKDVVTSIDKVYAAYSHHFPHNLDAVAPLMAFKNALVLSTQEINNV